MPNRKTLVAISPHLDDVVLGCSGLVVANPGAVVVTVTAGRPGPHPLTDWDRRCGFAEGDDVVGARRREDANAVAILRARTRWLDFLDVQYGPAHGLDEVMRAIGVEVDSASIVAFPLALHHEDHLMTAAACLEVARRSPAVDWLLYEDVIYRATHGGTAERLAWLRDQGFELEPAEFAVAEHKRQAIAAYRSQVAGLGELLLDAYQPERYWKMKARA